MVGSVALAPDSTAFVQETLTFMCVPDTCLDAGGREKGLTASWAFTVHIACYLTIWAWLGFIFLEHSLLRASTGSGHCHQILDFAWEFYPSIILDQTGNTVLLGS